MENRTRDLNNALNFNPRKSLGSIYPTFHWQNYRLNHFQALEETTEISLKDLSSFSLEDAITALYADLNFAELAGLYKNISQAALEVSGERLFNHYGFAFDGKLEQTMELYDGLPGPFRQWIRDHDISPRDLYPLLSLPSSQWPFLVFEKIVGASLSRNFGSQILELVVECLMMDISETNLLPAEPKDRAQLGKIWVDELKRLRYPQTLQVEQQKQTELLRIPWTKEFRTQWVRKGDESNLEVRFSLSSKQELQDKIKSLQRISETAL